MNKVVSCGVTLVALFCAAANSFALEISDLFDDKGDVFKRTSASFVNDKQFRDFEWTTDKENELRYFAQRGDFEVDNDFGNNINSGESSAVTIFSKETPEVNIRFKDSLFQNALIYVYNQADSRPIRNEKQFEQVVDGISSRVSEWGNVRAGKKNRTRAGGASEYSEEWICGPYSVLLTWSSSGKGHSYIGNYINLFVEQYIKGKKRGSGFSAKELLKNVVKKESGDVYVDNIPMVDQGPKGYCAVAGAARVFRYYGYETDMHRLANLAGTTADGGTYSDDMFGKMRRLSSVYHTKMVEYKNFDQRRFISEVKAYNKLADREKRMRVDLYGGMNPYEVYDPELFLRYKCEKQKTDFKRFLSKIKENVKKGLPVIWTVQLGMYREPKLNPQTSGGHLRLIIGYNEKTEVILFSDTWGRGHELKRLGMKEAWAQTKEYAVLQKN